MRHPYITTRTGSANLYYRRQIPEALQPFLGGRTEYWKSLRTHRANEARRRAPAISVEFEKMLEDARLQLELKARSEQLKGLIRASSPLGTASGSVPALGDADEPHIAGAPAPALLEEGHVPTLVRRHEVFALQTDDEERRGLSNADIAGRRAFMSDAHEHLSLAAAASRYEEMRGAAEALLDAESLRAAPGSRAYELLLRTLLETDLRVVTEQLGRLQGRPTKTPEDIPPLPKECDNWPAMLEAWKNRNCPAQKTYDETARSAERFQTLTGKPPVPQIKGEHVETFKARLREEGLSASRVNTIVALLRAVVFAAMKESATTLAANPFQGRQYSAKELAKDEPTKNRDAYTVQELNLFYRSRVYVEPYRPAKGGREAAFWLPPLGTFTGSRLEDLGCLTVGDFREFDGIPYVELGDKKRSGDSQRRSAFRKVPLHDELLRIGILEHVERVKKLAGGRRDAPLFPDLTPDRYGSHTKMFSAWFNEYLDRIGLSDPRLDFHALRAAFQYYGELCGLTKIHSDVIDVIVGHTPNMSSMRNRYGRKENGVKVLPFEMLVEAMRAYRIPGLDLSHLYVARKS